jgi:hypothetical protein
MGLHNEHARDSAGISAPRSAWTAPVVTQLPRLTDLTLQTGAPINGGGGTGTGSTTF